MDLADLSLVIKPMQPAHVPAVMEIERQAFPLPWPEHAYRHELTQNELAHYYVLCPRRPSPSQMGATVWGRLWQTIHHGPASDTGAILGYGGFWLMYDEAHISTLAVRAGWRRGGLGELLLTTLLDEARLLGARRATLEVRVSNVAAQTLYAKYGFEQMGRRKAYYADNGEDALILTTPELASGPYQELVNVRRHGLLQRLAQTFARQNPANTLKSVDGRQ
jgi:ribosomal-protein-alanine N-acetyltransferase